MTAATLRPRFAPFAATLALGLLGACSNPVDTTENVLPYLSEQVDTSATGDGTQPNDGCSCLAVGQWYRFDALALTSLDGGDHALMDQLNPLWESDIARNELNIMLEVTAVSDAEVTVRGVVGARLEGTQEVCEITSSSISITFPRDGCHLLASAEASFNVFAGTDLHPKNCSTTLPVKHVIPVGRAVLEGDLDETCSAVSGGKVPFGVLGESELGQICTCILPSTEPAESCGDLDPSYDSGGNCPGCNKKYHRLMDFVVAAGGVSWSCTTTAGDPATCITADFSAVRLPAAPTACPE